MVYTGTLFDYLLIAIYLSVASITVNQIEAIRKIFRNGPAYIIA